jgi:hypothetical protein
VSIIKEILKDLADWARVTEEEISSLKKQAEAIYKDHQKNCKNLDRYRNRLKDAEEVIAFYANYSSWKSNPDNDGYCDVITLTDSEPIDTTFNKDCDIGGKRAREYQKKYMEGK